MTLAKRHGVAPARNLDADRAKAPVLVFMDAHCIPRRGWLEKLLAELAKHDGGIIAPQISSAEDARATTFGLTISDRELGVAWLSTHVRNYGDVFRSGRGSQPFAGDLG